jgi:cell division protease FtsH
MVGRLGFSETFGLLSIAGIPKELLGPDVQRSVLDEARGLLEAAQRTCRQVLVAQRGRLDAMARALLVAEVLSGAELAGLLGETPVLTPIGGALRPVPDRIAETA